MWTCCIDRIGTVSGGILTEYVDSSVFSIESEKNAKCVGDESVGVNEIITCHPGQKVIPSNGAIWLIICSNQWQGYFLTRIDFFRCKTSIVKIRIKNFDYFNNNIITISNYNCYNTTHCFIMITTPRNWSTVFYWTTFFIWNFAFAYSITGHFIFPFFDTR